MTTLTKGVRGRRTKEAVSGYVVRTSAAGRLDMDLRDLREVRESLNRSIEFNQSELAALELKIVATKASMVEVDREIEELEAAIKLLTK
jgi:uncharacterized protein YlxW (UPF0749 family)